MSQENSLSRFVLKYITTSKNGDINMETIPVIDKSKEVILKKLDNSKNIFEVFELWGDQFEREDLTVNPISVLTIDEWYGIE